MRITSLRNLVMTTDNMAYKIERIFVADTEGKMKNRYLLMSKPITISGSVWTTIDAFDTYSDAEAKIKTFMR